MGLPSQNIPEKEKDFNWGKSCVTSIIKMVGNSYLLKMKDKFCFDMYNGVFNEADYDYLRKVDSYEYPAKIRFIPLLRPKADLLRSQEIQRPFKFRPYTVDQTSVEQKSDAVTREVLGVIKNKMMMKLQLITSAKEQLEQVRGQIDQMQQQAQQEGKQIPPQQMAAMKQAQNELDLAMSPLSSEQILSQAELEKIDTYYKYTHRDFLEVIGENSLNYMIAKYRIRDMFNRGFEDKMCTDKEYYYAHYHPGDPDPVVRRVNPLNFYYSNDEESTWVGDAEWTMEERYMTLNQIIDEFKFDIKEEHMEILKKKFFYYYDASRFAFYPNTFQYGNPADYNTDNCFGTSLYAGTMDLSNKIRVCYATWKSTRELKFKQSPNKYIPDMPFTHWMNDDDDAPRKEETLVARYVNDIWEGVAIDSNIFLRIQKMPYQLREIDTYGKVSNPYIGWAHNNIERRPYSLIWAAKDIQILYNLIHYHKELWLALSGVKGFIMDKSQMPDGMSMQEWLYQRKLGMGWIQSVREGLTRQPTYNQFQSFDDSISPAIQYLTGILSHLEELASNIMGVSRQRLGAMNNSDGKGTSEMAISQSALVTEIIFHQHDQVKRRVLERTLNLCRLAWKGGKRGQYVIGEMAQAILNVPEGALNSAQFEVWMDDNGKQERLITDLRQVAAQQYGKGAVTLNQLVHFFTLDNLKDLEHTLEKYGDLAEQKAGQAFESQQQADAAKDKANADLQIMLEKIKAGYQNADIEIQQKKLDLDSMKFKEETRLREMEITTRSSDSRYTTDEKASVDLKYLESENQQSLLEYQNEREKIAMDMHIKNKDIASKNAMGVKKQNASKRS